MIGAAWSLLGGLGGAVRMAAGAAAGGAAVWAWATLSAIPAAETRGHDRAMGEVARASAEKILQAVRERHDIEQGVRHANDCELLRILDPAYDCGLQPR